MLKRIRRLKSAEITLLIILLTGGGLLLLSGIVTRFWTSTTEPEPEPIAIVEPIIPTVTPRVVTAPATPTPSAGALPTRVVAVATRTPTVTAAPSATPLPPPTATMAGLTVDDFGRIGVGGNQLHAAFTWEKGLRWTHMLDWQFTRTSNLDADIVYWRTLRVSAQGWVNFDEWSQVIDEVNEYPGEIWIIGNEPDVKWQDGVSAEIYAERYHEAYTTIKAADPTAQIAVGAVAAGTELRLRYLDAVLATYQSRYGEPLPVDLWTVHAYVLREERDSWGIDIPPGMTEDSGDLYEIDDHDDLELFTQQLVNFRRWMADNDYREKPLAVTEFGILLPNDYGFPPESVAQYMRDTITIMLTLEDEALGLPEDDNRLVQSMFWFVFYYEPYPTGALWNPETKALTPLGDALQEFVNQ